MEESVRQVAGGAADVATGSLIQFMAGIHAQLDEGLQYCERELQNASMSASRFGPPGPVERLMGQVQNVWNHAGVRQNRINTLVEEKEQARGQCDRMATAQTNVQKETGQLRAQNERLQKENEGLHQDPTTSGVPVQALRATPQPVGLPSVSSESSAHSGLADQERIKQLTATVDRIRGEREALRKDNAKLKTANEQWRTEANREKLRNDTTIDSLLGRLQGAVGKLKQFQGQSSSYLPSHREMGGHSIRLPAAEGQATHSTTTGEPQRPSVLSPLAGQSAHLGASPQTSQLAP